MDLLDITATCCTKQARRSSHHRHLPTVCSSQLQAGCSLVFVCLFSQKMTAPNPAPEWITELMWDEVLWLAGLPALAGIETTFKADVDGVRHPLLSSGRRVALSCVRRMWSCSACPCPCC